MNRLQTCMVAAIALFVLGCGKTKTAPIALNATVSRGIHMTGLGGFGGGVDETFHVDLHIKNTSDKTISFEMAEASFVSPDGKGLKMKMLRSDENDKNPEFKIEP